MAFRTFTVAAMMLAWIAMPAQAQMNSKRHQGDAPAKKQDTTPKVDENAYKAALERIPDSKEKYDPWSITKPADSAKKPK